MKPITRFSLTLLAAGLSLPATALHAQNAPAPAPAAEAAKTAPSAEEKHASRLERFKERLTKKYGTNLFTGTDDKLKLYFGTDTDADTLAEVKQIMTDHAKALHRDLFVNEPTDYILVEIPSKWQNPKVTGHFYGDRVDAATIGCNLRHEFTHALHWADQQGRKQEHPVWTMEGLASLYESSKIIDGHSVPQPSHRLIGLQEQLRKNATVPFDKLVKFEHRQFTSMHYAQAHYMFMYLFQTQKLKAWYDTYTAGYDTDPTGQAAWEKVYGKPIAEIEKDWKTWALALTPPSIGREKGSPNLGIGTKQAPNGFEIAYLLPGGAAEAAGLALKDVILNVGDERTIDTEDLPNAVLKHKVGDKVPVRYRRDGKYNTVTVTLQAIREVAGPAPGPE